MAPIIIQIDSRVTDYIIQIVNLMNSSVSLLVVSPDIGYQEQVSNDVEFHIGSLCLSITCSFELLFNNQSGFSIIFHLLSPFMNFFSTIICKDLLKTKTKLFKEIIKVVFVQIKLTIQKTI